MIFTIPLQWGHLKNFWPTYKPLILYLHIWKVLLVNFSYVLNLFSFTRYQSDRVFNFQLFLTFNVLWSCVLWSKFSWLIIYYLYLKSYNYILFMSLAAFSYSHFLSPAPERGPKKSLVERLEGSHWGLHSVYVTITHT